MNKDAPLNIQCGDTIRLKKSLKLGKMYDRFMFLNSMDYRPSRVTILMVDGNTVLAKGRDDITWWYPFAMLDMRTLRKAKERLN